MSTTVAKEDFARMLREGAARLRDNHELLSKLDAATGDGDHGTTMKRVAEAIMESVQGCSTPGIGSLLEAVGWSVMSVDGGSTSPLLGSFFMGMSEAAAAGEAQVSVADVAAIFEAGLAKLRAQTPAKPGDKTMIDALVPAVAALNSAELTVAQALSKAADAAAQGAEGTKAMQAKFGRARNLGARTIGLVDPGATSISLMFAGFRDAMKGL